MALCLASAMLLGCNLRQEPADPKTDDPPNSPPSEAARQNEEVPIGAAPRQESGLHNVMRLTDRIYSGGEPEGEEGFATLAALGVKTVVSVDGAQPDVEAARKYRLRYIHIPIGYDGVSPQAAAALTRLVDDVQGPMYIHCHHGKHRGPAAAAVACVAEGAIDHAQAVDILERAGTSQGYAGLWRDVKSYLRPAPGTELPPLVETARVSTMAAAMSQLDRGFDRLKLCRDVDWTVPEGHPDIVPAQEALLVRETLHEAGRNLSDQYNDAFRAWLAETEQIAAELESSLRDGDANLASMQFARLDMACKRCHDKHRN
ncbi:MAG: hypothetical protein RIC55_20935 [Pirellulaceae bacterium]